MSDLIGKEYKYLDSFNASGNLSQSHASVGGARQLVHIIEPIEFTRFAKPDAKARSPKRSCTSRARSSTPHEPARTRAAITCAYSSRANRRQPDATFTYRPGQFDEPRPAGEHGAQCRRCALLHREHAGRADAQALARHAVLSRVCPILWLRHDAAASGHRRDRRHAAAHDSVCAHSAELRPVRHRRAGAHLLPALACPRRPAVEAHAAHGDGDPQPVRGAAPALFQACAGQEELLVHPHRLGAGLRVRGGHHPDQPAHLPAGARHLSGRCRRCRWR